MKYLFFPRLARSSQYPKKNNGDHYAYDSYRAQVQSDCDHRCIYCDIKIDEMGYEGFALDHFRPQEFFPHLKNTPENLMAACPKCNRRKSSHWPLPKDSADTHDGYVGFLDPFQCDRHDYFDIKSTGELTSRQGPADYMIRLLGLNRPSRLTVRKVRILKRRVDQLIVLAMKNFDEALVLFEQGGSRDEAIAKLKAAKEAIDGFKSIYDEVRNISTMKLL